MDDNERFITLEDSGAGGQACGLLIGKENAGYEIVNSTSSLHAMRHLMRGRGFELPRPIELTDRLYTDCSYFDYSNT